MEITEVKVFPIDEDKLKAFVSIVLEGCFMVNDIKIIRGKDGLFISMPSRRKKDGEFKDVAHPLNNDTRRSIEVRVIDEYERVLEARGLTMVAERRRLPTSGEPEAVDEAGGDPGTEPRRVEEGRASDRGDAAEAADKETKDVGSDDESSEDKSLEEIEEMHLRDSFWSVG